MATFTEGFWQWLSLWQYVCVGLCHRQFLIFDFRFRATLFAVFPLSIAIGSCNTRCNSAWRVRIGSVVIDFEAQKYCRDILVVVDIANFRFQAMQGGMYFVAHRIGNDSFQTFYRWCRSRTVRHTQTAGFASSRARKTIASSHSSLTAFLSKMSNCAANFSASRLFSFCPSVIF